MALKIVERLTPPARRLKAAAMEAQSANTVLLVRPAAFGFNAEAARTNAFSSASADPELQLKAMRELDGLERRLSDAGVEVLVMEDLPAPPRPDAVFPNNWFSTHADGTIVLYPMATAPRRLERRTDELNALLAGNGFAIRRIVDLSSHEQDGRFLEGTGSLVLDRPRRRAFAGRSPRTNPEVVAEFDEQLGYATMIFDTRDRAGNPIYHTNVLLSLGTDFAMLCSEAVAEEHRGPLIDEIHASERSTVDLGYDQLRSFGCNVLELRSRGGDPVIAMSAAARAALSGGQLRQLEGFGTLAEAEIPTIEAVGGGSVRCMIAEIHLPRR